MAKEPDVTVAIDLGTTFTGVGFLFPSGTIHIFNNWPGTNNNNESKVPSRLVYNHDNTVSSWGFSCALHDDPLPPGKREQRLFKMFLDPETGDKARYKGLTATCNTTEASSCTADFLREVYRHIKRTYEGLDGGDWFSATVVFLFSVPTTWRGLEASNTLKAAIKSAGFGNGPNGGPHHSVRIDLTEAEAAAVDILKSGVARFNEGDVFLTIDAGGGTTDLSLVQVTKVSGDIRQMSQIAEVSGIGVGSMLIDYAFGNLVEKRLARSPDVPVDVSNSLAYRLMNSERFQTVKHLFGDPAAIASVHKIPIPGVSNTFNHEKLGIERGEMIIDDNELRGLFNPHVKRIIDKIQMQLDWMVDNGRSEQVTRVVLSGGLGKSHYVHRRISEHFARLTHPNARNVRVIASKDPQTTVVRGLLEDQKQKLETGNKPVLATYIARASYGVVVREAYDPDRHIGEDLEEDSFNPKHLWAIKQIAWLVRKGDKIDPNVPIKRHFESRLQPGGRSISLSTEIVTSKNETGVLPQSKKKGGIQDLCRVDSTLNDLNEGELEFKKKRRVWGFSKGYKYYNCPVDVQVIVAPADLRFELWFKDQRVSRDHDPINVIWN